jgi:hypothetical protein
MAKVKETIHDDEEFISFYQEQVIRVVRKCKKVRWLKLIYTYASEIVNNEGEKRHG